MSRQIGNRLLKTSFVVIGDGQTEQYYLKHLKEIKKYNYSIRPSLFNNISFELAEEIIDDLLSGGCDKIVFITDYDTVLSQSKQRKFNEFKNKYSNEPKVIICESMPCVEFWFLLHFIDTTKEYCDSVQLFNELKKFIKDYSKERSFLEKSKWVNEMHENGKFEKAIASAVKNLKLKESGSVGMHFPFTKVHLAIETFEEMKK